MRKIVYGADLAGYFKEKGDEKLARIFARIGEDELEPAQALSLARHNGYSLTMSELADYLCEPEDEEKGSSKVQAKEADREHEVRASDIVEYLGLVEYRFDERYCDHKAKEFKKLGSKALSLKEALKILPKSKSPEWGKIIAADIEAMYLGGPSAVINRTRSEKHRFKDNIPMHFSPESPRKSRENPLPDKSREPTD
jgi:hypothetical protein